LAEKRTLSSTHLVKNLPAIIGIAEFKPTGTMIEMICHYLQNAAEGHPKTPLQILKELGHSKQNWYDWHKRKEGFADWFNTVITEYHSRFGLHDVYNAIYREALKNSAQDRKLYLERFDDKYRPKSEQEIKASVGRRPPDSSEAIELSDYKLKQLQSASPVRDDREVG